MKKQFPLLVLLIVILGITSCEKDPYARFTGTYTGYSDGGFLEIPDTYVILPHKSYNELIFYDKTNGYKFTGNVYGTRITMPTQTVIVVDASLSSNAGILPGDTLSGYGDFKDNGASVELYFISDDNVFGGYKQ